MIAFALAVGILVALCAMLVVAIAASAAYQESHDIGWHVLALLVAMGASVILSIYQVHAAYDQAQVTSRVDVRALPLPVIVPIPSRETGSRADGTEAERAQIIERLGP